MNRKIVLTIILIFSLFILMSCSTETTIDDKTEPEPKQEETSSVDDSNEAETKTTTDEKTKELPLATDFELLNLEGEKVSLSDYKGQKIFLNFWASWCGPCQVEMPDLNSFYEAHKSENFVILAVNVGEDQKTVESFITDHGYTMPVLLDDSTDIATEYLVRGIPTTFVINESFEVVYSVSGTLSMERIEALYEKFNQTDNN